jgi:hypothetical protein
VSDWICVLDGGSYSHAAIWDGERVLEASGALGKVQASALETLIDEHEYTHVYRFFRDGIALGEEGWSSDPVVAVARSYLGSGYPYGELCLLGVLTGLGRVTGLPRAEEFFRTLGPELLRAAEAWEKSGPGERPMTCAHFVSRAFWEADVTPSRRYALEVPYTPSGLWRSAGARCPGAGPPQPSLSDRCRRALGRCIRRELRPWRRDLARGHRGERALGAISVRVLAGGEALPVSCVTPKDLERSPSLHKLGTLGS